MGISQGSKVDEGALTVALNPSGDHAEAGWLPLRAKGAQRPKEALGGSVLCQAVGKVPLWLTAQVCCVLEFNIIIKVFK